MADEEDSSAAVVGTAQPDVRTILVDLLSEVKKMNANFANISYSDEDEPPPSSTDRTRTTQGTAAPMAKKPPPK